MFDIFKKVKDKVFGDLKSKLVAKGKEVAEEVLAMAKAMDLDGDGVKDIEQVQGDVASIIESAKAGIVEFSKIGKPAADLAKLGGLYYLRFGAQKPSVVVASLQEEKDLA